MIAFVQPFGLYGAGGGARILRSLLSSAPVPYLSVNTHPVYPERNRRKEEVHLPLRPHFGVIDSTRLAGFFGVARFERYFGRSFKARLRMHCIEKGVQAIHAIPHGLDFWYAYEVAVDLGIPYFVSVHDDLTYNLRDSPNLAFAMEKLEEVWKSASGRTVISPQMGEEYARRYGDRPYKIVTDGLTSVAERPRQTSVDPLRIYVMGLIHLSYEETFSVLFGALNQIGATVPNRTISLTSRGGLSFSMESGCVQVSELPWGTQQDIDADLDKADLLYLPLPIESVFDSFTRFSLSTKLVTYLGSGIPILYHGPAESAAACLLKENDAAICSSSTEPNALAQTVLDGLARREEIVANAIVLARSRFMLEDQKATFWEMILNHLGPESRINGASADRNVVYK